MNSEVEGMWKETVMTYYKVLSRHSPERTEGNHVNLSELSLSLPRLEPGVSRI
jgi:hypothetical protein